MNTYTDSHIAQCLAILQGKESRHTLQLTWEAYKDNYDKAFELFVSHYVAIKQGEEYKLQLNVPSWNRRIR